MKYIVSIYPVKRPIIEMGLIDRNKFLNNCYCLTIECNTIGVITYELQLWAKKNLANSLYGFYIYNHKNASNYFIPTFMQLLEYIERGELNEKDL